MTWRQRAGDARTLIGLAQGLHFLWVTVPIGAVGAVIASLLPSVQALPTWAIVVVGLSTFVLIVGALNSVIGAAVRRWRPKESAAYVALTEVIDEGEALLDRLLKIRQDSPPQEEIAAWEVRTPDWIAMAEQTVGAVAPKRLAAFRAVPLYPRMTPSDVPYWARGHVVDLATAIEKLHAIRMSL